MGIGTTKATVVFLMSEYPDFVREDWNGLRYSWAAVSTTFSSELTYHVLSNEGEKELETALRKATQALFNQPIYASHNHYRPGIGLVNQQEENKPYIELWYHEPFWGTAHITPEVLPEEAPTQALIQGEYVGCATIVTVTGLKVYVEWRSNVKEPYAATLAANHLPAAYGSAKSVTTPLMQWEN